MENWERSSGKFKSWDDVELFYRAWKPNTSSEKALIFIHRGHEHSGRIDQMVEEFGFGDCWAFSWDNRGHGNSPGDRGDAETYYHLVRDLDSFVKFVSVEYGIAVENMVIVANSVGAVTASAWVHDFAPRIRGMVLAAPAFRIRLYVPFAVPMLRMLMKIKEKPFISSYVKSRMLTHDKAQAKAYDDDELITPNIAVNVLLGLHDTATRIIDDAGAITTPTLILAAGSDLVVKNSAQRKFYENLSSPIKQMESYKGFFHAVLYEKERERPIARAREFIREAFKEEIDRTSLLRADKGGYTKVEYDLLRQKSCLIKSIFYGCQKAAMKTIGRLSQGVRLGWSTGFDSGKTLDYVYENKPRGAGPIGRAIDKNYLEAIGWKGIRQRRVNIEQALQETTDGLKAAGEPVHILDVATGCGRYVLNVLKNNAGLDISAELRDYEPKNVEAGRQLAERMKLEGVTFSVGDAFNEECAVETRPTIAIVSGLYELFPDNGMIRKSLKAIAGAVAPGGYLIYTGQPWHPQVELIARTLDNRDGDPWIMRRRSQAEMDELVSDAGFEKIDMEIDEWGIFTVSVARRRAS